MSYTQSRPFDAATSKFAYAQAFTTSSLHAYDEFPQGQVRRVRGAFFRRDGRFKSGRAAQR